MYKTSATVNHFTINHTDSFITKKPSTLGYSCIFNKFLPWNFGKTPSSRKRFCAALYSPPSVVNIMSYSEIKRTNPISWITKITECVYTNLHYYIMCFKSYHILSWKIITLCIKVLITFCINIITFCISFTFCRRTGLISGPGIFGGFAGTALGKFLRSLIFAPIINFDHRCHLKSRVPHLGAYCPIYRYAVLHVSVLKSEYLIANQIWEFCKSYDKTGKILAFWIAGHGDYYHNTCTNEVDCIHQVAGQNEHPLSTNNWFT